MNDELAALVAELHEAYLVVMRVSDRLPEQYRPLLGPAIDLIANVADLIEASER